MSKSEKIFKLILQIGFFLALLFPLAVDRQLFFPYVSSNTFYFRLIAGALVLACFIFVLIYPKYRPKRNILLSAMGLYLLVLVLATIFSSNPYLSFWGDAERMMGLVGMLYFFGFFLAGIVLFREKKEIFWLLNVFVGVSLVVSFYGIFQKFGLTSIVSDGRIVATLGNADTLASYLIFGLFFSIYLAFIPTPARPVSRSLAGLRGEAGEHKEHQPMGWGFISQKRVWRIIYSASAIVIALAILLTLTRGAFFGVAVGFLFAAFVILKGAKNKKINKVVIGVLVLLVIVWGALFLAKNSPLVRNNAYLYRITHISLNDATVQGRLMAWKWGLQGFVQKPILGYGFENFAVPFSKYFQSSYYTYSTQEYFDRAHNILIEHLSTTGILGFLAYLFFIGAAFYLVYKFYKKKNNFIFYAIFGGLLIAYFGQNLFAFDLLPALVGFDVFLIVVNNYWQEGEGGSETPVQQKNNKFSWRPGLIFVACLLAAAAFYFVSDKLIFKPFNSFRNSVMGQVYMPYDYSKGLQLLKLSVSRHTPYDLDLRSAAGNYVFNYYLDGAKSPNKIPDLDWALNLYKQNLAQMPLDTYYNYKIAEILDYRYGTDLDVRFREEARIYAQRALETSPDRASVYYILAENLAMAGKFDEAITTAKKAIALNENYGLSYWELTKIYFQAQKMPEAKENLLKTIDLGYHISEDSLTMFAPLFDISKSAQNEIQFLELVIKNGTNNYIYDSTLANLYLEIGDKVNAIAHARRAAQLNPDPAYQEKVNKFLNSIE